MIEAYAFFAAFLVQILVVSVLFPAWLARYARAKADAQLPGLNPTSRDRFLGLYRAGNAAIAVVGLALLGWLFNYMQREDWDIASVSKALAVYMILQMLPIVLISLIGAWIKKRALVRSPLGPRRTASLERRGLFDIVPRFIVFLAVLAYVLFAGFVIYAQQHLGRGFAGYVMLRTATLVFAVIAFSVYWHLYRRKRWPLETRAYRMQAVELQVRIAFYTWIVAIVFLSINTTLRLQHLVRWMPFALSVYGVIIMLLTSKKLFALRRQAEADLLAPAPAS